LDIVYMHWERKDGFIVFVRDDLSGWVEGRVLESTHSEGVAKFLQEEVFCRHGVPRWIVMDGGSENMGFTPDLIQKYGMRDIAIALYHPSVKTV
jgi:hypothetical protein